MIAKVTYTGGRSYSLGPIKFKNGIARTIQDPELINYFQTTRGFKVEIMPEKIVREIVDEPPELTEQPTVATSEAEG